MAKEYKNITKWPFWALSLSISLSLAWSWLICLLITLITCLKVRFALIKILNLFSSASQFLDLKLLKPIQIYFSRLNHINPLSSCLSPQCQSPRAEPLHMWGRRVSRSSWPCTSRTLRPPWTGCSSHGKRWVAVDGLRGRRGLDRRYATDAGPLRFFGDQHLSRWLGCQILLAGDFLIFGLGGRSQWNFWSVLASPMQSWWSCWCRWGGQCPKKEKTSSIVLLWEIFKPRQPPLCSFPGSKLPQPSSARIPPTWQIMFKSSPSNPPVTCNERQCYHCCNLRRDAHLLQADTLPRRCMNPSENSPTSQNSNDQMFSLGQTLSQSGRPHLSCDAVRFLTHFYCLVGRDG